MWMRLGTVWGITDLIRPYTLEGDRLVISGAPGIDPITGQEVIYRMNSEKSKESTQLTTSPQFKSLDALSVADPKRRFQNVRYLVAVEGKLTSCETHWSGWAYELRIWRRRSSR